MGVGRAAAELVPEDGEVSGAFGAGVGEDDQDDKHREEEDEDEAATYEGEEWAEEHVGFLRSLDFLVIGEEPSARDEYGGERDGDESVGERWWWAEAETDVEGSEKVRRATVGVIGDDGDRERNKGSGDHQQWKSGVGPEA